MYEYNKTWRGQGYGIVCSNGQTECCSVDNISASEAFVDKLINAMRQEQVAPLHMHDIAEDSVLAATYVDNSADA
ncbi:MAG: DUF6514 family protein [Oscillospiraceae bacterium]|nr:DUF6514 family protein [Oscillospiraceae bacterium]